MMDKTLLKFCNEINFQPDEDFEKCFVDNVEYSESEGKLHLHIVFDYHIDIHKYKSFLEATKKLNIPLDLEISVQVPQYDPKTMLDYLQFGLEKENPSIASITKELSHINIEHKDPNILIIKGQTETFLNRFNKYKEEFENVLHKYGYPEIKIMIQRFDQVQNKSSTSNIYKKSIEEFWKNEENKKDQSQNFSKPENSFYKKNKKEYKEVKIDELDAEFIVNLKIKGQIFNVEYKNIKENFTILKFTISDFTEAKIVTQRNPEIKDLKNGDFVEVSGTMDYDNYLKIKLMNAHAIQKINPLWNNFLDTATKKRIELAIRGNLSTQDGLNSTQDYINLAKRLGHEAIAITDTDSVQSFPDLEKEAKNANIKPIYGVTSNLISKSNEIVYGTKDFDLKNQKYIVFDLETSGLSPIYDEIIEFGAVIIQNGEILEKIQFFMKPTTPISAFTTELTKIDNDMLESLGISQLEGAIKIHSILQSGVAVAHNASFDIGHVRELFKKHNLQELDVLALDTLNIARILFPQNTRFRLSSVSKKFDVFYDDDKAHRADQDAKVLSDVWIKMIIKLERDLKITNSSQLRNCIDSFYYSKKIPYEVRILAKNQTGLKQLFKIFSKASTDNYNAGARIFIEDLEFSNDLFIGTSTHNSYFWNTVFTGTSKDVEELIKKYDYIEFAPISTYNYQIKKGQISENQLKDAYKWVIELAKKYNKIPVAVSDCRYIDKIQKLAHQVYIFADQVNAKKHWLFNYKTKDINFYPTLDFKTTNQMLDEFKFLEDKQTIEDLVINNTHLIASQIEKIQVIKDKLYVPNFDNSPEKLKEIVYKTAYERYGNPLPELIETRIKKELNPIIEYGYSVIYWISHKLIKQAGDDGWLVGSRGSVGSSIVANLSGITEVNPLPPHYLCPKCKYLEMFETTAELSCGWDLPDKHCPNCNEALIKDGHSIPFETFLGFNADKVPDIDLNFSGEYQNIIHNTVKEMFGEKHTYRAGTVLKVKEKTGYGFAKKYDELVNAGQERFSNQFLDFLGNQCTNVKRTTGQHPGGIIIIPKEFDVEDFTPVVYPANDDQNEWKTTHFDFKSIHDNVLKLDLLGKDDPTTIKMLENLTNVKYDSIPKSDPKVLSLFNSTEALNITADQINERTGVKGIPEFGTRFVRGMLKTYTATSFADLISLSGLSHGTNVWTGNAEELIKTRHLKLSQLVCCRDDIMAYLIRNKVEPLSSFKIMEKVRKGKGITDQEEKMLLEHNVPSWYIESMKKIEYMFPKAHATAYVIMAWRIAWYKIYYPLEYYASYFTTRASTFEIESMTKGKEVVDKRIVEMNKNSYKLSSKEQAALPELEIAQELYARGFKILPVSIEKSQTSEWIIDYDQNALIPPFTTIDSMGISVAQTIVDARNQYPILSVEDLMTRTKVNSRIQKTMQELGILDGLPEDNRISLFD
ncbi:PolC-type DNA polymerase III [Mycoplasma zalophi]|uniref:DNA polymerase III PolC-type n=2 Tax=Mycoplasma zalophi TaxID=191287 RepID=A0ABS6DPB8_9MOLU|nr:PolC-type DNA polymerase III [Mycoplasma zalophi]